MSKLRVPFFGVSLDGYGAGPRRSLENPLGVGGELLHKWFVPTRSFQQMLDREGGTTDVDQYLRAGLVEELHLAVCPALLGSGEALFRDLNLKAPGYHSVEHVRSSKAAHVVLARS
jgi:hypothetical protein